MIPLHHVTDVNIYLVIGGTETLDRIGNQYESIYVTHYVGQ